MFIGIALLPKILIPRKIPRGVFINGVFLRFSWRQNE